MRFMLASANRHKLREFRRILAPHEVLPMPADVRLPSEGETSFTANALGKARALAGAMALAGDRPRVDYYIGDDSGLEVEALDGRPGVRSARYAGDAATDAENNAKLLRELAGAGPGQRAARFVCVLAVVPAGSSATSSAAPGCGAAADAHAKELVVRGEWCGTIAAVPRGAGGFGYDPLFVPDGDHRTVAELPPDVKDRTSHRALAGAALLRKLAERT